MAQFTDVEKVKCVLQLEQNHSATMIQQWFHTNYSKEAPTRKSICKWYKSFSETGHICARNNNSGSQSKESVEHVCA
jgi:hypothetical protein